MPIANRWEIWGGVDLSRSVLHHPFCSVALHVVFGRHLSNVFQFCASVHNADQAVRRLRVDPSSRHVLQSIFDFVPTSTAAATFWHIHDLVSSEHEIGDDAYGCFAERQKSYSAMFSAHLETIYVSQRDALWEAILAVKQIEPPPPAEDCGTLELKSPDGDAIRLATYRWGEWRTPTAVLLFRHIPEPDGRSFFHLRDHVGDAHQPTSLHLVHGEIVRRRPEFVGAPYWYLGGPYAVAHTQAEAWLQFTDGAPCSLYDIARQIAAT